MARLTCSVKDCHTEAKARGWCNRHYLRWWVHGDPTMFVGRPKTWCWCGEQAEAKGLCHRHYQRLKYQRDPEKFREVERLRRKVDGDRVRALEKFRREANPHLHRTKVHNRKARLRGAPGSHTAGEWLAVLELWDGRCAYCGAVATTKDHIIPVSQGGSNDIANIVPACQPCNSSKGAKTPEEWMAA